MSPEVTRVAEQVFVLFILVLIGFIIRRAKLISVEGRRNMAKLVTYVTLPATVISSFNRKCETDLLNSALIVFAVAFVGMLLTYIFGNIFIKDKDTGAENVLRFGLIFSNCGFMGYPVIKCILPENGMFLAAVFNIAFTLLLWTVGISIYRGKKSGSVSRILKSTLLNPGMISVAVAVPFFAFSISMPSPVAQACEMLAEVNSPLSMLTVGVILADSKILSVFKGIKVYRFAAYRLLAIPAAVGGIMYLCGLTGEAMTVCIILFGMPMAANTAMFAETFGGNAMLASKCVFLTTVLSMLTIPLLCWLIQFAG